MNEDRMFSSMTLTTRWWIFARSVMALVMALALSAEAVRAQDLDDFDTADASREESSADAELLLDPSLWVLDFEVEKVRSVTLLEGTRRGEVYWCMIYTLRNRTGEDRDAYISVTARSDDGRLYSDIYMPEVERAVERKLKRPLWGRSDLFQLQKEREDSDEYFNYTTIEAGETRRCVAVFNKLDPGANHIEITVRGLSNDLKLIDLDDGTQVIEERVYVLRYERPEDRYDISLDRFFNRAKGWSKLQTPLVIPEGNGGLEAGADSAGGGGSLEEETDAEAGETGEDEEEIEIELDFDEDF